MISEEKIRCLNELMQLITTNEFSFVDIRRVSSEFFQNMLTCYTLEKLR